MEMECLDFVLLYKVLIKTITHLFQSTVLFIMTFHNMEFQILLSSVRFPTVRADKLLEPSVYCTVSPQFPVVEEIFPTQFTLESVHLLLKAL